MRLRLLCCNLFQREACYCLARTPHVVDVTFLQLGEHARPHILREILQSHIRAADVQQPQYDAILLLFGLCGNATAGLSTRHTPLIIPRAHDCATILLGSRAAFQQHFADNPSQPFGSVGYVERGNDYMLQRPEEAATGDSETYAAYVAKYGEENARYIWETLHPQQPENRAVFISIPETAAAGQQLQADFHAKADAAGQEFVLLNGNIKLIDGLINGPWPSDEYLTVPPGHIVEGVYDAEQILRATPISVAPAK